MYHIYIKLLQASVFIVSSGSLFLSVSSSVHLFVSFFISILAIYLFLQLLAVQRFQVQKTMIFLGHLPSHS
jgi:hypothetical protein